jgi:alanine racemase
VTDWENHANQAAHFRACVDALESAGVAVSGTDFASTLALAADGAQGGSAVRIGVGLFGASGGVAVPGLRCALRIRAPVTRVERVPAGSRMGYGARIAEDGEEIAIGRCGYADGLPKELAGSAGVLSIGMQYVTARASLLDASRSHLTLLDETSDLDAFAARAARLPHEIVTAFGNAASANAFRRLP